MHYQIDGTAVSHLGLGEKIFGSVKAIQNGINFCHFAPTIATRLPWKAGCSTALLYHKGISAQHF
jgi:hypothetical protein